MALPHRSQWWNTTPQNTREELKPKDKSPDRSVWWSVGRAEDTDQCLSSSIFYHVYHVQTESLSSTDVYQFTQEHSFIQNNVFLRFGMLNAISEMLALTFYLKKLETYKRSFEVFSEKLLKEWGFFCPQNREGTDCQTHQTCSRKYLQLWTSGWSQLIDAPLVTRRAKEAPPRTGLLVCDNWFCACVSLLERWSLTNSSCQISNSQQKRLFYTHTFVQLFLWGHCSERGTKNKRLCLVLRNEGLPQ